MANDIFGDLQNWVRVVEQMERLASEGSLDQHQTGLIRVARYPFNWRLRQAALRAIGQLKAPREEVIDVVLRILANEHGDLEIRIQAGDALARIISNGGADSLNEKTRCRIERCILDILEATQPPVLHSAAEGWRRHVHEAAAFAAQ